MSSELARASALIEIRRYDEAERILHEGLAASPDDVDLLHLLAQLHIRLGRRWQGDQALDRCLALDPDNVEVLYRKSLLKFGMGQRREARRLARRAVAVRPDSLEARLANIYANIAYERFGKALAEAQTLAALYPDEAVILTVLGDVQMQMGRARDAEETYRQVVALHPDDPNALTDLARVVGRRPIRGRKSAEDLLRAAVRSDPSNPRARSQLGDHAYRHGGWRWLIFPFVLIGAGLGLFAGTLGFIAGAFIGGIVAAAPIAWLANRRIDRLVAAGRLSSEEEGVRREAVQAMRRDPLGRASTRSSHETSPFVLVMTVIVIVAVLVPVFIVAQGDANTEGLWFVAIVALLTVAAVAGGIWRSRRR